jgi:hypothetical protein
MGIAIWAFTGGTEEIGFRLPRRLASLVYGKWVEKAFPLSTASRGASHQDGKNQKSQESSVYWIK